MTAIRVKLIDELGDQVPEKVDFNDGYYEGKLAGSKGRFRNDVFKPF